MSPYTAATETGIKVMKDVCFTGHRSIVSPLYDKLRRTIERLINEGSDMFYAGGALGFDMLAAETVIDLRAMYPWITLVLVLPCPPHIQTEKFSPADRERYYDILFASDRKIVLSEYYTNDCMKQRNQKLVDLAEICVCYYDRERFKSGTAQTVRMAERKGIEIIDLF